MQCTTIQGITLEIKKEKLKIDLYTYNFDKGSRNNNEDGKNNNSPQEMRRKRKKMKHKRKPQIYKYQDPYDVYEPTARRGGYKDGTEVTKWWLWLQLAPRKHSVQHNMSDTVAR